MRNYHPTYYLTDEAMQKRITRLINRIATEGRGCADYQRVPASVRKLIDAVIDGRLIFADQMEAA